jgi:helix-turn-helix protein
MAPKDPTEAEAQLTPEEAAVVVAMSESWLAKKRVTGDGPPYRKVGRSIRYSPTGLARWLKSREHRSTSEYEEPRDRKNEDDERGQGSKPDYGERRDGRHRSRESDEHTTPEGSHDVHRDGEGE